MSQNESMNDAARASQPATGAVALAGGAQALAVTGRSLLITGTGNISFTMQDGTSTITWNSIPVGEWHLTVRSIQSCTASGYVLL